MNTAPLVPCGGCRRHVRASEPTCPFCASPISDGDAQGIVPEPTQRLSRAGVLAFAAAFLSSACDPQSGPTRPDPTAADAGMMQTIYGGPPPVPTPPTPPMPNDLAVPAYGGPPPMPPVPTPPPTSAKPPVAHPPAHTDHHPVTAPAYGLPPPRPTQRPVHPGGSAATRYGAPPRPDAIFDK